MINYILISFSAVQIHVLSYIHLYDYITIMKYNYKNAIKYYKKYNDIKNVNKLLR